MAFRFIPREEKFYHDFMLMGDHLRAAGALLEQMFAHSPIELARASDINDIEHAGDHLTRDIILRVNKTFVTPIDREDIHALAIAFDDVLDAIDAAATLFPRYRIDTLRYGAHELAQVILRQTHEIRAATNLLEHHKGVMERVIAISELEHDADKIHNDAIRLLFDEEKEPILIMKWKEIYDFLERTTDRCEDVANVMEAIVVKHG